MIILYVVLQRMEIKQKVLLVKMFDGDEMNIHLAQSIQARNELKHIANVKLQIIAAKDSNPIIGCVQDTLSGAYKMTLANTKILGSEVSNFLCNTNSETKYNIDKNKYYTGQEIFTYIIPKGINKKDKKIEIVDGVLKSGLLDKNSLSTQKNSIIHFIWDKFGPNKTSKFIDDSQRLILNYLMSSGLTISFGDCIIPSQIKDTVEQMINNVIIEYNVKLTEYENDVDQLDLNSVENILSSILSAFSTDLIQLIEPNLDNTNNLYLLWKSGAKGKPENIQKIMGCMGNINLEGQRIKKKVENRTLPIFHQDDDTPVARGFVKSSLFKGVKAPEFFYDAMAGREGLIDTAIRTGRTGYIQRQLIKGLEDLIIKYDNTNRTAKNVIIQYVYGENGINQSCQTELYISCLTMNNEEINKNFGFNNEQIKKLESKLKIKNLNKWNMEYTDKIKSYRNQLRLIQSKTNNNYKILEEKYMLPINLFRLTQDYSNKKENIELTPQEIDESINDFLNDYDMRLLPGLKSTDKYLVNDDRSLKFLLEIALHDFLAPVKCIFTYGLTKTKLKELWNEIKISFVKALVEPGELVGIIAAQSIGEPTTQMGLNKKHSAGAAGSSSNINSGVSRIEELLHYSKNIKTPQTTIYFDDNICSNKSAVNKINSYLKYLSINELIDYAEIYYDIAKNDELSKKLKNDNVLNPFFVNNTKAEISSLPFVFRLKLNIEKMHDKETTVLDIKTKFISYWNKNFSNTKNMKKIEKDIFTKISRCAILNNNDYIIHIRFSMSSFNYNMLTEFLKIVINKITLKGIENITDTEMKQENRIIFDDDTGNINNTKEYIVYTAGINIEKLKYFKGINMYRTFCNDIETTYKFYGIEAARHILLNEFMTTFGSSKINHNHMSVLIDMMTHTGNIISIDRHGLNKVDSEPIAKASFEKTMDNFINAAIFNEKDNIKSLSSHIMLGRVIPGGTGAFDILLDTEKLENSEYVIGEEGSRNLTFIQLEQEELFNDIVSSKTQNNDFFIPK